MPARSSPAGRPALTTHRPAALRPTAAAARRRSPAAAAPPARRRWPAAAAGRARPAWRGRAGPALHRRPARRQRPDRRPMSARAQPPPLLRRAEMQRQPGQRMPLRRRRGRFEQQRDAERVGQRPQRMQRLGIRHVGADQQHRPAPGEALPGGFQQPGGEAGVVRAQAGRRRPAGGGDVPVAGGGVVDRIGEACRRQGALGRGQRLAQRMAVGGVAGRRREHGGQAARVDAGHRAGLVGDRQRQPHDGAAAAPLGRRQAGRRRQQRRRRLPTGRLAQHRGGLRPAVEPRPEHADAGDAELRQWRCDRAAGVLVHRPAPNSRQAFEPPKPKELLATTDSRASRLRSR